MHPSGHLSDDTLDEYLLGRLPEAALQASESHLLECQRCRRRLERLDGFVAGLRRMTAKDASIMPVDPPEPPRTNGETSDPGEPED